MLGLHSPGPDFEVALFSNDVLEFKDSNGIVHVFQPNETRGYFTFECATSFPFGITAYKTCLHASTIANSYKTMEDQNLNVDHRIASYFGKESNVRDNVVGFVKAVDFPSLPAGGWKLPKSLEEAPRIRGVACFFKQTQGMTKIVGEHSTGRHRYTVSKEVDYDFSKSGLIIELKGKKPTFDFSTGDIVDSGYEYVPVGQAPEDLLKSIVLTDDGSRIRGTKPWKGRNFTILMGGMDSKVHFSGLAVTKYGAEGTAKLHRMAASQTDSPVIDACAGLSELLKKL